MLYSVFCCKLSKERANEECNPRNSHTTNNLLRISSTGTARGTRRSTGRRRLHRSRSSGRTSTRRRQHNGRNRRSQQGTRRRKRVQPSLQSRKGVRSQGLRVVLPDALDARSKLGWSVGSAKGRESGGVRRVNGSQSVQDVALVVCFAYIWDLLEERGQITETLSGNERSRGYTTSAYPFLKSYRYTPREAEINATTAVLMNILVGDKNVEVSRYVHMS